MTPTQKTLHFSFYLTTMMRQRREERKKSPSVEAINKPRSCRRHIGRCGSSKIPLATLAGQERRSNHRHKSSAHPLAAMAGQKSLQI
jgi:hypothetical protein